jgi:hypothetical protein
MKRFLMLAFVSPLALFGGCSDVPREPPLELGPISSLSGGEIRKILVRNTLVGHDDNGTFWMHFPKYGTVWGKSSTGDVDIGRWWISGDQYCRAWRRWQSGKKACWAFASDGGTRLIWILPDASIAGESRIQIGNTIGGSAQFAAVDDLIGADISAAPVVSSANESVPVDARGVPLILALKDGKDPGVSGMDGGDPTSGGGVPNGTPNSGNEPATKSSGQGAHDKKNGEEGGEGGGGKSGSQGSKTGGTADGSGGGKGHKGGEGGEGG